jgi:hypothetical protein
MPLYAARLFWWLVQKRWHVISGDVLMFIEEELAQIIFVSLILFWVFVITLCFCFSLLFDTKAGVGSWSHGCAGD